MVKQRESLGCTAQKRSSALFTRTQEHAEDTILPVPPGAGFSISQKRCQVGLAAEKQLKQ